MPMLQVFTFSEPGGHATNEDAFAVRSLPTDSECHLCAVADGQGGRAGGAAAATVACRVCLEVASGYTATKIQYPATWRDILKAADQAVAGDPAAGLTTLVAFCIWHGYICGASCGDSAAVVLSADTAGTILTKGQYKNPPVGSGGADFVPFGAKLSRPWTVLAMTDGVWKFSGWEHILSLDPGEPGGQIIQALPDRAKLQGSGKFQDDFTVIVLQDSDRVLPPA